MANKPQYDFWLNDPSVLFNNNAWFVMLPQKGMSTIEILNALTRFCILLIIIFLLFSDCTQYIYVLLIIIIIIIIIYFFVKESNKPENFDNITSSDNKNKFDKNIMSEIQSCQQPTADNPFMNVTLSDIIDHPNGLPACPLSDEINKKIDDLVNNNFPENIDDVFNRKHSQRQFYTTASTTIPNDQYGFAKWLYDLPETCKENQLNCLKYEDVRYSRHNPAIDSPSKDVDN